MTTRVWQGIKYRWHSKLHDQQAVHDLSKQHNLSLPIANVLWGRGITTQTAVYEHLFGTSEADLPPILLLKDVEQAADRVLKALSNKEKILIFGDYDVDGVTSTSLLLLALIPLGANINYFLPQRARDGYGLSTKIVDKAADNGYHLIITVDNGITAIEPARRAAERKIDLIITDHHRPHDHLPEALAIVNPNQVDCAYPSKSLAGVGVTFKLACMIYQKLGKTLPDKVYELLLLGTVADVVPMVGENRYWIRYGLSKVNKQKSLALAALIENSKLHKEQLTSLDIGFMIAPQINALGRLDDCREAVSFLISSDEDNVKRIGRILYTMNEKRKQVEQTIVHNVESAIINKHINLDEEKVIFAAHNDWPSGVIGLVAGKLMNSYGRPTFLFHIDEEKKIAKGSCRSIKEFNIFDALQDCKDLLTTFGGHSHAAGLSLPIDHLPLLKEQLEKRVTECVAPEDLQPKLMLDAPLTLGDITKKFFSDLSLLEPFGHGNAQPLFFIERVTLLAQPQLLKGKHVKCSVFADGVIKPVIFFNRPDLYTLLMNKPEIPFTIAGHVIKNEWEGSVSYDIQGLDIAFAP